VWEIATIPLRAYALCIIAGIILAIWWGERRWMARGGTAGTVIDIAVFAVPFGLVGGRLYHVATDHYRYFGEGKNPLDALKIWDGGLGIWGAIALGAVGAWIGCRSKGVPLPAFADAIAPGIVVAQALGRVGNYFNQELYGGPTNLPWGLEIYRRENEQGAVDNLNGIAVNHIPIDGSPVHPTFLYELLWNLLVAALVVWIDRRYRLGHGRAFAVYVMGYTLGRTWIELMRTDPATPVFGVRVNVWVSGLVFLGAVVYLILARSRGEREDPESLRGKDAPPPADADTEADPDADGATDGDADTDAKPKSDDDPSTAADRDADDDDADLDPDKPVTDPDKATPAKDEAEKPAIAADADEPATAAEKPAAVAADKPADADKAADVDKAAVAADKSADADTDAAKDEDAEKKADASAKSDN
jgi:prolipoprotein diacylglyceryl transferase